MIPRGTIAGIAAVLLACSGVAVAALRVPQQADSTIPALIASLGGRCGDEAAEKRVARDSKGGQFSIFADGLDGAFTIEIDTDLTDGEQAFLRTRHPRLEAAAMDALVQSLTRIKTGEIQPHYLMSYGFYDGTTPWRTDPVALASVFGLRTIEQIEAVFPGRLYEVMMRRRVPVERREPEAGAHRR